LFYLFDKIQRRNETFPPQVVPGNNNQKALEGTRNLEFSRDPRRQSSTEGKNSDEENIDFSHVIICSSERLCHRRQRKRKRKSGECWRVFVFVEICFA
jgi:hypothetical protein